MLRPWAIGFRDPRYSSRNTRLRAVEAMKSLGYEPDPELWVIRPTARSPGRTVNGGWKWRNPVAVPDA
jgi:hypothetical protein